jgi:hypothetical protein
MSGIRLSRSHFRTPVAFAPTAFVGGRTSAGQEVSTGLLSQALQSFGGGVKPDDDASREFGDPRL